MTSTFFSNPKATLGILGVFVGCSLNIIFLEQLVRNDPGCGNLVTFASFVFISLEGFIFTTKFGTISPKISYKAWTVLVVMYFLVSVANNYALNFNISMPLHMIFRAGSLMANMIMGMVLLGKRYSPTKYLSILMITIGIAVCTIMSAKDVSSGDIDDNEGDDDGGDNNNNDFFLWCIGISMLTFALFLSARMGVYQEVIYKKYGKHPKEALYYSHCLPLPGFLFLAPDIMEHFRIAMASEPLSLLGLNIPSQMALLALNVLSQYLCISSVFVLTSECASLTVTLVVTLRKFFSLLFSIWYFDNPFTVVHWIGTFLVFSGTLIFSDVYGMIMKSKQKSE